jgi:hypothetical protein
MEFLLTKKTIKAPAKKKKTAPKKTKAAPKKFELQQIDWLDHWGDGSWKGQNEIDLDPPLMTTVGYLLKENAKVVCLAADLGPKGSTNGRSYILKSCITKRSTLHH